MNLKLMRPSLDAITVIDKDGKPQERLVFRGVIDASTIDSIKTAEYQREILSGVKASSLTVAAKNSTLPDIELGMRGDRYQTRIDKDRNEEFFILLDDIYVIDGLQRINAIRTVMASKPENLPRIGAMIHTDTDFDWERERFRTLNQERSRLSPSILLRNARKDHPGLELLYNLSTTDSSFILNGKVSWEQRQKKTELIPAMRFCRTVSYLHSRFIPGGRSDDVRELIPSLDKKRDLVGPNIMRDNIKAFFDLIDECWNIRHIVYREQQPQIKATFLEVVADFLTRHEIFWSDKRLFVKADHKKKLSKFAITDPEVSRLCGSGGQARNILFQMLIEHFNSGKRHGRIGVEHTNGNSEENGHE